MRYTVAEAKHLYEMACQYSLSGANLLKDTDTVVRLCNGVGADWMPDCMTKLCTKLNAEMEIPAAIHDMRYVKGTTRADRQAADMEFWSNTLRVIEAHFPWWNPIRYLMIRRATRYYTYLRLFGDAAWEAAKKK